MISRRRFLATAAATILATPLDVEAQPARKLPVVGFLSAAALSTIKARAEAFRQGLRDLGYVERQSVVVEWRSAEGRLDRLPALAAELVRLKVDVIVAAGGEPPVVAAKQATQAIPIVMVNVGDPVETGLVASLGRPGGNITGLSTTAGPEIYGKQLALLKETLPSVTQVALLSNPDNAFSVLAQGEARTAAGALGITLRTVEARAPDQFDRALSEAAAARAGAVLVVQDPMLFGNRVRLADLAVKKRLPTVYGILEHAEAGGLMAYAANRLDLFHRAAGYVDRILKGARPADLPIEQPTKFELVVNLKTARTLGLTIPPAVLSRADHVIE
jgi:putative ABC transport system substrate-binding protein